LHSLLYIKIVLPSTNDKDKEYDTLAKQEGQVADEGVFNPHSKPPTFPQAHSDGYRRPSNIHFHQRKKDDAAQSTREMSVESHLEPTLHDLGILYTNRGENFSARPDDAHWEKVYEERRRNQKSMGHWFDAGYLPHFTRQVCLSKSLMHSLTSTIVPMTPRLPIYG